jgi:glycosyltransferase involved in cell wall biosynthesis
MKTATSPAIRASVLCFPYYPSKDTGRGHDRYAYELVQSLEATGDKLELHVVEQGFSKGALGAGRKLFRLAVELLAERSDVYHAISPTGGAVAALLGKRPLVVTVHDLIPFQVEGFDSSWKARLVRACTRLCIGKSAAIIVPYRVTKEKIASSLGGDADRIFVVSYGVDHETYYPRPELTRAEHRILYIGEVSCSKGVDVLIRAFAEVKRSVPRAELVIGGKTSKDQPTLEALARSLAVPDIVFKGFVPEQELATYYATTTVMAFPSRYGFGLSVLEAMACGTPVVAAAALDAPEFAEGTGILVPPDDPAALAARLVSILTDSTLRAELSKIGSAKAAQYSWSNLADGTQEVYARVAAVTHT